MRPPTHTSGRLGVGGVVPREGAFGDESFPAFMPGVQRLAPSDGLLGGFHAGQQAGQFFQFPAGLESGSGGQVGAGVALHMHQTALDPGAGPRLQARRLRAAQPVGDQHIGRGDPGEQGQVGGLGLVRAPLEGEDFSALAVDGGDQAPAVAHVRAVGHDRVALRVRRGDARPD